MRTYLLSFFALICTAAALAQKPPAGFSFQNEIRLRYEQREDADFDSGSRNDPQDLLGRLRLGVRWTDPHGWSAFFQPQLSFGDSRRSLNGFGYGNGTDLDPHIHQFYTDVKSAGLSWRLGRQELVYGDERLIGSANWLNKGRSWDGARIRVAGAKTTTDVFGGTLGHFDFKTNMPTLAGIYSTVTPNKTTAYDLYILYKSVGLTATTHQSIYTVGTRPVLKFSNGFDAKLEAAYQFGTYAGRPVSAYAGAVVVGYTPRTHIGLRLFAEYDYASGGNPTGTGTYRTFDQLFPTNHAHYGLADYVGWRNMQDVRLGAQAKPLRKLSLTADGHFFRLANATDFWYGDLGRPVKGVTGAQLRDPSGASGKDLGTEVDVTATYALARTFSVSGGYARFMPGSFVRKVNNGKAAASNWFYVQTLYGF